MTKDEKKRAIEYVIDHPNTEEIYYELLDSLGALKNNYWEYLTTDPINVDKELERVSEADYDLCAALLTLILREDHFANGSLKERYQTGEVDAILRRMIKTLY